MEVFFIKAKVAHRFDEFRKRVLWCFDPATTLYLFEPGESTIEPSWESTRMSILATCDPDRSRYKEFCKNGAEQIHMPLFMEDELLTIGRHIRQQPGFPAELNELYTDAIIRQSFFEYGGIIPHVLPYSADSSEGLKADKRNALAGIDWMKYVDN
eukprot:gene37541-50678_t